MSTWNSIRKTIHEMNAPPIIRSIYDLFVGSLKKFATDDGTYLAAGMSYYIFFSIFPFLSRDITPVVIFSKTSSTNLI